MTYTDSNKQSNMEKANFCKKILKAGRVFSGNVFPALKNEKGEGMTQYYRPQFVMTREMWSTCSTSDYTDIIGGATLKV